MITAWPALPVTSQPHQRLRLLALALVVLALHAVLLQGPLHWPASGQANTVAWPAAQSTRTVTLLPAPQLASSQGIAAALPQVTPTPIPRTTHAATIPQPAPAATPDPAPAGAPTSADVLADVLAPTARSTPPQPAPRLPRALTLDYLARRGAQTGEARLDWAPSPDGSYRLTLRLALPGRPESGWISTGHTSAMGLAPDRMVEERRQRPVKAINFQRDKGLISFSSSTSTAALQPGGQDRISWLVQLSGLAQALDDRLGPGTELGLQVATVGGLAETWTFRVESGEGLQLPDQPEQAAWRLVREPQRPYDQRVEVWLSRGHGLLPLQLRMSPVPAGEPLLLWLRDPLGEVAGP